MRLTLAPRLGLVATFVLGAALALGASGLGRATEPSIAPAFSVPDVNGSVTSLASYANRPVLLVFYRGFW